MERRISMAVSPGGGELIIRIPWTHISEAVVAHTPNGDIPVHFTGRQQQIFDLLCNGLRNKEIADIINLTERTVKFHVSLILSKLNFKSKQQILQTFGKVVMLPRTA